MTFDYFEDMTNIITTSARIYKFNSMQQIQAMSRHSLRLDGASLRRVREGARKEASFHWSSRLNDEGVDPDDFIAMRDVEAAFKAHKKRHGIGETKNGGLGIHLMVNVTPSFITDQGQLHDRNNPANQALFAESMAFARSVFGENSLYAARMDLDEKGGGVVDLFLTPMAIDGRAKKLKIATSKFLTALRLKHGERMSFSALQTEWADWCQNHLHPSFERGKRKFETRAEHLGVEEYRQARALAQLELDRTFDEADEIRKEAEAEATNSSLATATDYLIMTDAVAQDKATMVADRLRLEQGIDELTRKRLAIKKEEEALGVERTALEKEKFEVFNLKMVMQQMISGFRDMFSILGRLKLSVQEREVVKVMEAMTEKASSETSADELSPS